MDRQKQDEPVVYNFQLEPYQPLTSTRGKLHCRSLLDHSFRCSQVQEKLRRITEKVENAVGKNKTVWGVKIEDGRLSWELYFYKKMGCTEGYLDQILSQLRGVLDLPAVEFSENIAMFSFDLLEGDGEILPSDILHIYTIAGHSNGTTEALSYDLDGACLELQNRYTAYGMSHVFPHANRAVLQKVYGHICSSARFTAPTSEIRKLLMHECHPRHQLWIAHKRTNDGVYFQGLTSAQLRHFIDHTPFHDVLGDFIRENEGLLDHLEWDVGFDYTANAQGVEIKKAGFYGYF